MRNFFSVGFVFILLIIVGNTLFVVKETERAVMLRFAITRFLGLIPLENLMLGYKQRMRLQKDF